MAPRTKLHFARFEFKYILLDRVREEFERELRYFVEFDPFVEHTPDNKYVVRSLYFDDPSFTCFYNKHDGLHTRSKFRIRTYTFDPSVEAPCFLEIKGRHNNLVFKHRTPLDDEVKSALRRGSWSPDGLIDPTKSDVGRQFQFELYRKRLRPVALVDYYRRPYVSKYDPEFRLTFDEQLHGCATTQLFPSTVARRRRILPGFSVMEVKFRYHIPSWFHRLIQSYELRRVSISKICAAMECLELAENPS